MSGATAPLLLVVAGLIERDGSILLTQRRDGRWEFPGGKVEPEESPPAAIARELFEELGLAVLAAAPVTFAHSLEPPRPLLLLLYRCDTSGDVVAREGQAIAWLTRPEARAYDLLPLDRELLKRLP